MTGGWKAHFDQMSRWYTRLIKATEPLDRLDFLYAFFESSHTLNDWLQNSGAATEESLRRLSGQHEELRINRDFANSLKHYVLSGRPSQPNPPSLAREYNDPGYGNFESDSDLVILSNGKKYNVYKLAGRLMEIWSSYVATLASDVKTSSTAPSAPYAADPAPAAAKS
jgi:hypothetical protein